MRDPKTMLVWILPLAILATMLVVHGDRRIGPTEEGDALVWEGQPSTIPAIGGDYTKSSFEQQQGFLIIGRADALQSATGDGVTVAMLDSGVRASHEVLAGHLTSVQADLIDDDSVAAEAWNGIDDDGDGVTDDGKGHGTFSAGLVAGLAPDALIMPIRVLDDEGRASSGDVAAGIYFAVANGADVICLALGLSGYSPSVEDAIEAARATGVVVVTAAGNHGASGPGVLFPAGMPETIGVTSLDNQDVKPSWAAYDSLVSIAAPGVGLIGPWVGGDAVYAEWSGTSFSAAIVAAAAALILENETSWGPAQVEAALLDATVDVDSLNPLYTNLLGEGRIDLSALFE